MRSKTKPRRQVTKLNRRRKKRPELKLLPRLEEGRRQKVVRRRKLKVETRSQRLLLLQKKVKRSLTPLQLNQRMQLSLLKRRKPMPPNLTLPNLKHQKMLQNLTLPRLMLLGLMHRSLMLPSLLRRLSLRHQKMLPSLPLASECIL